jgi:hypothetical protein
LKRTKNKIRNEESSQINKSKAETLKRGNAEINRLKAEILKAESRNKKRKR